MRGNLASLLDEIYSEGEIVGIQMYEDYISDDFSLNGYWYYPLTVITRSGYDTVWIKWALTEGDFKNGVPYSYVGEGELEEAVRKKAGELNVLDRVIFTGARRDAAKVYSAMDAFCLPSFYEGMSLVGWEAQSNGLACLFSDQMTTETVLSGDAVQLPLEDAAGWAKRLAGLKRNGGVIAPDITQTVDGLQTFYLSKDGRAEQSEERL